MKVLAIYDHPTSFDRYTVVVDASHKDQTGQQLNDCLGLSDNPTSPLGFSQWSSCINGDHLGQPVELSDLPQHIQTHIQRRLA